MDEDQLAKTDGDSLYNNPEDKETTENKKVIPTFYGEISSFITDITSLSETFKIAMKSILKNLEESTSLFKEFEKTKVKPVDINGKVFGSIETADFPEFTNFIKKLRTYHKATKIIPRSFIVSLISEYDVYLSKLLRIIYLSKPELLNASEKNISLKQLFEFNSIEEAKESIIEKEIDCIMRESHIEQFRLIEIKLNIKLTKDLPIWTKFVELTERRNLYVHNDGTVSNQYLKVCKENNINVTDINLGDELDVSPDYYEEAFNTIFEIGFKLGQVLWRKFIPEEINNADENLISIGYDTLYEENYLLTKMIFDFAIKVLKKHGNEENRRMMIINQALAYKWDGDANKSKSIIRNEDWSATMLKYRLAEAIILDNYEEAYRIMRIIGNKSEEVCITNYREWPLFKEIKKEQDFLTLYEELFGEPYNKILPNDLALTEEAECDSSS